MIEHREYHKLKGEKTVEGTERIKAFSDGVIAIVMTLLVLEIRVPEIHQFTSAGVIAAFVPIIPKLVGFAVSFLTVAIFWVNHHHFFDPIEKTNGRLLWHNNFLLFWVAVVPFVTAFIGDYPYISFVVALYGFVLFMAVSAFSMMSNYVFFHSSLVPESVTQKVRIREFRRSLPAVVLYCVSIFTAFLNPYISLALFILLPLYYFVPSRIETE
ncbi:MAG TPA: TMEM175 family protein [Candidatus Paceibacterota bacterium]|jgi:uncharacterized membrane protein|nr:TMEM175 family protein [Candidatus Paceibacterota bacterium]